MLDNSDADSTTRTWDYCFVDPEKGIAVFDNMSIQGDPIRESRWDQIIPVLEEEQVLMCREISSYLKPGDLVLDAGTGSGVYAILAAKQGCKVIAIDINPRSITQAKINARNNNLTICNDIDELENGSIYFQVEDFNEEYKESHKNYFDIVICVPGYTPTLTSNVVFFAEAGEDGQQCCRKFLKLVPGLLKDNGLCLFNHMSLIEKGEQEPTVISDIKDAFKDQCDIDYARMIKEDCNLDYFYRKIYKSFLLKDKTIEDKIMRVAKQYDRLALLYIKITKKKNNQRDQKVQEFSTYTVPNKGWDYRMHIHRQCIEYSSNRNFKSLYSTFLQDFSLNIPEEIYESNNGEVSTSQKRNIFEKINNYISWKLSWDNKKKFFDLILIDTAPINGYYADGNKRLSNQIKVWLPELVGENTLKRKINQDVLKEYQLIIYALQKAKLSIITHPYITQIISSKNYWDFSFPMSSTLFNDETLASMYSDDEKITLKKYSKWLEENRQETNDQISNRFNIDSDNGYSFAKLNKLQVPNNEEIYKSFQDEKRFYDANKYKKILTNYNGKIIEALNDKEFVNSDLYNELFDLLQKDAEYITLVLHKQINSGFNKKLIQHKQFETENYSSRLLVFPLGLKLPYSEDRVEDIPLSYRGGVWIYARTSSDWSSDHEDLLNDIARMTWLFFLDEYSLDYQKLERERKTQANSERLALLHQFPKDLTALDQELSNYRDKIDQLKRENPDLDIPLFNKPDSLGVILMFTKAAQDHQLIEMPEDCARILYGEWNEATIEEFIDRVVWTQAKNRALNYPEVKQKDIIKYGVVQINQMFQKPKLIFEQVFKLDHPQGIYPLLLLALRSAYQHSYRMTLLSDHREQGEVKIEYLNQELTIYNTGLPSLDIQNLNQQKSWEKDTKILEGLTSRWQLHNFGDENTTQCSVYDPKIKCWITKITQKIQ